MHAAQMLASLPLLWLPFLCVAAHAADLSLTRATLSSSGVGQYDFSAEADGPGTLRLEVPLSDVDDVLKSLRVADPAGPVTVRLAGREPLAETFRTLPFGQEALASPDALLAALVGAQVRLPLPGTTGRIVGVSVETQTLPDNGGTVPRHRLTIATDKGIESVILEDSSAIEFPSDALRAQIAAALSAVAAQSAQDRRQVEIVLTGAGKRRVTASVVLAAPVWKASYRLILGADAAHARLDGSAVVENLTGRDWKDVDVTLTSGEPVLYRQNLYEALFADRPEAPVDVPARVAPRVDQGATPMTAFAGAGAPPPAPAAAAPMMSMKRMRGGDSADVAQEALKPAEASQGATQVNFHLASPVTAASGQTLLLPFVAQDVKAERVALYQPDVDRLHPLVALRLVNDTGAAWPAGLATLYGPEGFVGDARLPATQPGQTRLASFAVDLGIRIDQTADADSAVVSAKAARGVLTLTRRERSVTTYRIANGGAGARTVLVEQPRRTGWEVVEPAPAQVEAAPSQWRISQPVEAGKTATLRVVLQRPTTEAVALTDQSEDRLASLATNSALPPEQLAALRRISGLRADLDARRTAAKDAEDRAKAITDDQDRVRKNLAAVPPNSELQRGYLSQMQQQEKDLAALRAKQDEARTQIGAAEGRLRDAIAELSF